MDSLYRNTLKERMTKYGTDNILDEEILSYLTGIPIKESKKAIDNHGLIELINFGGNIKLTESQKRKLELLYMFNRRLNESNYKNKPLLDSSSKSGEYFINQLKFYCNEVFLLAFLDNQNRLINCIKISEGTINEAPVYPREVVKHALFNNANAVILAHVHPGGSLSPSKCDINVTEKLTKALNTIGIKVIDHIIVGDGNYVSLAEKGLINNE